MKVEFHGHPSSYKQVTPAHMEAIRSRFVSEVSWLDFSHVDLTDLDLRDMLFENCAFSDAYLMDSDMSSTKFRACRMERANMSDSVLDQAEFSRCDLRNANLGCVSAYQGKFSNSLYVATNFKDAYLEEVFLSWTKFHHPNFSGADLTNARFRGSIVTGADFTDADLTGVDFTGADLTGAYLDIGWWYHVAERPLVHPDGSLSPVNPALAPVGCTSWIGYGEFA